MARSIEGGSFRPLVTRPADQPKPAAQPKAATSPHRTASRDELSTGKGRAYTAKALETVGRSYHPDLQRPDKGLEKVDEPAPVDEAQEAEEAKRAAQQKVDAAKAEFQRSVDGGDPLEATRVLNAQLEELPENLRGDFLKQSAPQLEQLTEQVTKLSKSDTAEAVKDLSHAAELAGPLGVQELTRPMAKAIADGKLEQKGDDADGGYGVFKGANQHHSEREFVDGIKAAGGGAFADSLASSLQAEGDASQGDRADRAHGFAAAVATGKSDLVPDDGLWTKARNLGKEALGAVHDAASRVDQARIDARRVLLDKTLDLSDSIDSLENGDKLTLGVGGGGTFGLDVAGGVQLEVERNDEGEYVLTGSANAAVGASVKALGFTGGLTGKMEYTFKTAEEAKNAARVMMMGSSPQEVVDLQKNLSAIQIDTNVAAGTDFHYGIGSEASAGAEGELSLNPGMRVEFEDGKPVALVQVTELKASGTAGFDTIADRMASVAPGEAGEKLKQLAKQGDRHVSGEASVLVETRIELEGVPGDSATEKVNNLIKDPLPFQKGLPTTEITFSATGKMNETTGSTAEFKLSGINAEHLPDVVKAVALGDYSGAVKASGVEVEGKVEDFTDEGRGLVNDSADLVVANGSITNSIRRHS